MYFYLVEYIKKYLGGIMLDPDIGLILSKNGCAMREDDVDVVN